MMIIDFRNRELQDFPYRIFDADGIGCNDKYIQVVNTITGECEYLVRDGDRWAENAAGTEILRGTIRHKPPLRVIDRHGFDVKESI